MRLDHYLVAKGLVESRNKAQQLIQEGHVRVNAKVTTKASLQIGTEQISVDAIRVYVSRSAQKLKHFLPELPFCVKGMRALDIGASTGGFTEVLLEFGAQHVDAVDVGQGQLHERLKRDKRVTSIEQTDIRQFTCELPYDIVVSDVSFISLILILDNINILASQWMVLLFKPQFEVGREVKRDRHGVIKDNRAVMRAMQRFEDACTLQGWVLVLKKEASLRGREGNIEYCYCYRKH